MKPAQELRSGNVIMIDGQDPMVVLKAEYSQRRPQRRGR
jgi:translation elongation factor P/translation initiation factor 5A